MKMLKTLLGGKAPKPKKPKPEKRSPGTALADLVCGLFLDAVKWKWNSSIWEPKR